MTSPTPSCPTIDLVAISAGICEIPKLSDENELALHRRNTVPYVDAH